MSGGFQVRLARAVFGVIACAGLVACGQSSPPPPGEPLWSDELVPDVLAESSEISLRPTLAGNRFLRGWKPLRAAGRPALTPSGSTRIELVNLGDSQRALFLDLDAARAGEVVRVRVAGQDRGEVAITDPLRIPLESSLPVGRVQVELEWPENSPTVLAGAVRPARQPGEARWEAGDLVQEGASLVEFVRRVPPGASLVGEYVSPASRGKEGETGLFVEGADGGAVAEFSPSGGWWAGRGGGQAIRLDLGPEGGLFRFRFLTSGEPGEQVRWRNLSLSGPEPSREADEETPVGAERPRLTVVYVMDALRADYLSHLGGPAGVSPTWDRLAAEGATFLNHRSVAPNTLPSTKALFTGQPYVEQGGSKLPADGPATLAERFGRAGYRTGLFSGNVHVGPAFGTDRGFDHVASGLDVDSGGAAFNDNAARVQAAALEWLGSLPAGEPAFLYLHTIHPHNPYAPPPGLERKFTEGIDSRIDGSTRTLLDLKHFRKRASEVDQDRLRGLYAGAFSYNDEQLAGFVEALGSLVAPEETLLVLTSDHGEELFDHGGVLHGYTLYEEMMRVPLTLWAPGRVRPGRIEHPSDTLDLHATLISWLGLGGDSGGTSLLPLLAGEDPPPPVQFAAASSLKGGIFSARTSRWKVIWAPRTGLGWGMGEGLGRGYSRDPEFLFDLAADPEERHNRAGDGDLEAAWLRSRLLAWIDAGRHASPAGEPAPDQDPEVRKQLKALGYVD